MLTLLQPLWWRHAHRAPWWPDRHLSGIHLRRPISLPAAPTNLFATASPTTKQHAIRSRPVFLFLLIIVLHQDHHWRHHRRCCGHCVRSRCKVLLRVSAQQAKARRGFSRGEAGPLVYGCAARRVVSAGGGGRRTAYPRSRPGRACTR